MAVPRYRCHKEVSALKIAAIEFEADGRAKFTSVGPEFYTVQTAPGFRARFKGDDDDLGYYVTYADGYESWSPSKAFEEGYTRIEG